MLYLIKKDFIAGAWFLALLTIVVPFITSITLLAMLDHFGGIVIGAFTVIVVFICIYTSLLFILIESAFSSEMVWVSLPHKRKSVVLSKYVVSFLLLIYSFLLVVLTSLASIYLFGKKDWVLEKLMNINALFGMFLLLTFALAFILPFYFKYDLGKGAVAGLISMILLVVFFSFGKYLMMILSDILGFDSNIFLEAAKSFVWWLKEKPGYFIRFFLITIAAGLWFLSIMLSIRFFNSKDI